MPKKNEFSYYEAIGRRKSAVARVRLYTASKSPDVTVAGTKIRKGEIYVNNRPIATTFVHEIEKIYYQKPLNLTKSQDRFAISIHVKGGGKQGQLEAIVHGLSRALEKADKESFRPLLKRAGLLTRDPRTRERRKVGKGGKARRKKQSPKR